MKNKLKELFMAKILASNKKQNDISSYSMIRTGTGSWNNKIYWKVQGQKKVQVSIIIKLNNDIETVKEAINAMEEIIYDGTKTEIDFEQKTKKTQGESGW